MKTLVYNNDIRNEGREEGREEGACAHVRALRKMNIPDTVIFQNLIEEFNLNEKEATRLLSANQQH